MALCITAYALWQQPDDTGSPTGFASGNGRIETTEIDVATKFAGRLKEITIHRGDNIVAGQSVARMDSEALDAQLREAQAQVQMQVRLRLHKTYG